MRFILSYILLFCCVVANAEDMQVSGDTLKTLQLDEVVIVDVKESGGVRQQPAATTIISNELMEKNHHASLKGASNLVPNMYIPDYGSRLTSAIYIRGIGSRINNPAVGLYVDNMPFFDKSAFDFNLYDIERVDVLRGPQGTIYGRNTLGGLVRAFTKNPLSYEGTDVKLGYATADNHRNVAVTHYHHLNNNFAFSAGGYYEGGDGFFKNETTGKNADGVQSGGGRIRAIYRNYDGLKIDFQTNYDYSDEKAYPYFYTGTLTDTEQYAGNIGKITNNHENKYRRSLFNAGVNVEYITSNFLVFNAITSFQHLNDRMFMDQDFMSPDIYTIEQRQRANTINEEITLKNSNGSWWKWISGANIMYQNLRTTGPVIFYNDGLRWLEGNINVNLPSINNIEMLQMMGFEGMSVNFRGDELLMDGVYKTPTLTSAVFHQSTFNISRMLDATVGLRLEYERKSMDYNSSTLVEYGFAMPNSMNSKMAVDLQDLQTVIAYDGKVENDNFAVLPKVALNYHLYNELLYGTAYSSFSMGQRSGGYNLQMFSELLQGTMRINMMNGIKEGVGNYLDYLVANNPNIPQAIPYNGQFLPLPTVVRTIMDEKMPKFEEPTIDQISYKPEYSWNFELGTKLNFDVIDLLLDAAVFYNNIYNQQLSRFAPSGLGRMMVNAGKSQSYGGEISAIWREDGLTLSGNYGYTHSTFVEYEDGKNNYAGKYVPFVPMHTVSLDADYKWKLRQGLFGNDHSTLSVGANISGAGRIYWTESNNVSEPFYSLLSARIAYTTGNIGITLWGKNLTNTKYNTFYFESASRGYEQHGKPLQLGIDLNIKL